MLLMYPDELFLLVILNAEDLIMASGGRWDADCRKAMQELTSGKAIREDVALLMAPHANFEQFLTPAPLSICILGKLGTEH